MLVLVLNKKERPLRSLLSMWRMKASRILLLVVTIWYDDTVFGEEYTGKDGEVAKSSIRRKRYPRRD